ILRDFMRDSHPFFYTATSTTEIYTLSLHDALPIWSERPGDADRDRRKLRATDDRRRARRARAEAGSADRSERRPRLHRRVHGHRDRKSTRLNSSHVAISYAVFCLKKKTTETPKTTI